MNIKARFLLLGVSLGLISGTALAIRNNMHADEYDLDCVMRQDETRFWACGSGNTYPFCQNIPICYCVYDYCFCYDGNRYACWNS